MSGVVFLTRRMRQWVAVVLAIFLFAGTGHAALVATKATTTSVTLTWNAPSDGSTGTVAGYDIRYSTSMITEANWLSATQVSSEPTPAVPGTQQSMTVTGLTPGTRYYFAAKSVDNSSNWSPLSSVVERQCPSDGVAPSAIANLATSGVTQTSATLTWTAPGDDGNTGTATAYDIRYSTSAITAANFSSATRVLGVAAPKSAGSAETITIPNLTFGTMYYFAVRTTDEWYNWSGISNVVTGTTSGDTTPPAAVTDLTAN